MKTVRTFTFIGIMLLLSSCGKQDEKESNPLLGKWKCSEVVFSIDNNDTSEMITQSYTFDSQGSVLTHYNNTDITDDARQYFYDKETNDLYIGNEHYQVVSITPTQMILKSIGQSHLDAIRSKMKHGTVIRENYLGLVDIYLIADGAYFYYLKGDTIKEVYDIYLVDSYPRFCEFYTLKLEK